MYANGQVVVQPLPTAIYGEDAQRPYPLRRLEAVLTEKDLEVYCQREMQKVSAIACCAATLQHICRTAVLAAMCMRAVHCIPARCSPWSGVWPSMSAVWCALLRLPAASRYATISFCCTCPALFAVMSSSDQCQTCDDFEVVSAGFHSLLSFACAACNNDSHVDNLPLSCSSCNK